MSTPRPRAARLLTAFSPKLGRTVRAFDRAGFDQWVRLEADPGVISFCEHPCRASGEDDGPLIDFWVARRDKEEMLVVERNRDASSTHDAVQGVPVRVVPAAEQAAAAVWVSNWLRIVPVINATRDLVPKALPQSALRLVHKPLALSFVEHELAAGDPSIVRGAIFELLRTDQLSAPSLHTQPLSLHTALEPRP
jgi:hypothetical protein